MNETQTESEKVQVDRKSKNTIELKQIYELHYYISFALLYHSNKIQTNLPI